MSSRIRLFARSLAGELYPIDISPAARVAELRRRISLLSPLFKLHLLVLLVIADDDGGGGDDRVGTLDASRTLESYHLQHEGVVNFLVRDDEPALECYSEVCFMR